MADWEKAPKMQRDAARNLAVRYFMILIFYKY
jgi:hypothetical protein